ncbi:hypothetical protein MYSTI_06780 [Myxococcus stipitatus DSM 14675]|uniref:Uncharacterized protein n=1 Tax=Myxococcus stipitatus (strain DSM 14675 / JCM 12634 / Mx s8) TaxID=1278073 RepID=L7UJ59_MYXSD|nr:GIY-YIG nuclease family protein [Myxococcus stipitatus]AGC48053.1 hypothetical protein MYSTI_06780 [Myxococcus stipitatus DSM 14675]
MPLKDAAQGGGGAFANILADSGVYVLRVRKEGTTDLEHVKKTFTSSPFMKLQGKVDASSGAMFAELGLGEGQNWAFAEYYLQRLERLDRLSIQQGRLTCPIIYIGRANNLQRRLNELAFYGHTINAPFWALLMSGWELEVGIKTMEEKTETAEEARLKELYRELHDDALPPFVHR